jgi:hypothetical protein
MTREYEKDWAVCRNCGCRRPTSEMQGDAKGEATTWLCMDRNLCWKLHDERVHALPTREFLQHISNLAAGEVVLNGAPGPVVERKAGKNVAK